MHGRKPPSSWASLLVVWQVRQQQLAIAIHFRCLESKWQPIRRIFAPASSSGSVTEPRLVAIVVSRDFSFIWFRVFHLVHSFSSGSEFHLLHTNLIQFIDESELIHETGPVSSRSRDFTLIRNHCDSRSMPPEWMKSNRTKSQTSSPRSQKKSF